MPPAVMLIAFFILQAMNAGAGAGELHTPQEIVQ